jgi:hypothetical protein
VTTPTTGEMTTQKLNYIHANPLQGKWNLADTAIDYRFSSAAFYETGIDSWGFITHIHEVM